MHCIEETWECFAAYEEYVDRYKLEFSSAKIRPPQKIIFTIR